MLIYKIFRESEWTDMQDAGETAGAPVDLSDGYIHFSTAAQARETAEKHFAGLKGLVLVAAETDRMGDLRWEVSRGGEKFPHLYEPFRMAHVAWHRDLPLEPNGHVFPAEMR